MHNLYTLWKVYINLNKKSIIMQQFRSILNIQLIIYQIFSKKISNWKYLKIKILTSINNYQLYKLLKKNVKILDLTSKN